MAFVIARESSTGALVVRPAIARRRRRIAAEPELSHLRWWPALVAALLCCALPACAYFANHYLVHPGHEPAGVESWSDDVPADQLLIHVRGARPRGEGVFPAIVVHPEGGKTAADMQGVVWDLAQHGYAAIAADYERQVDGGYHHTMFAWRSPADATAILDVAQRYPFVGSQRLGLLGFSQGAVFSLLIAEYAPDRIAAVVAYYPVVDFPRWLDQRDARFDKRLAFSVIRWYFRRESGATTDAEFEAILHAASPYYGAEQITAPVLLVHGDRDTTAPLEESQRMAARLSELGRPVELLVVPEGRHIFNFRQPPPAALAWQATLAWFADYLR